MLIFGSRRCLKNLYCLKTFLAKNYKSGIVSFVNRSSTFNPKESYVVLTDDGQAIVCWHPEKHPAYEHTKALPKIYVEGLNEADSELKVQYLDDTNNYFKPGGPTIPELAKMTFTSKHRWYPNNKHKYEDPNPPIDRDGI